MFILLGVGRPGVCTKTLIEEGVLKLKGEVSPPGSPQGLGPIGTLMAVHFGLLGQLVIFVGLVHADRLARGRVRARYK